MSAPPNASPQDLQAESLAREIANDMPSPYCPGRSIASCPTQAARDLEDDILGLAKQGRDREQIESALVTRFGEEKMGSERQGDVMLAVVLGSILALAVIVIVARRWLRPADAKAQNQSEQKSDAQAAKKTLAGVSADELDRLEDELDELDGIS